MCLSLGFAHRTDQCCPGPSWDAQGEMRDLRKEEARRDQTWAYPQRHHAFSSVPGPSWGRAQQFRG